MSHTKWVCLAVLLLALICCAAFATAEIEINETNFPDAKFCQYIIDAGFDTDGNGTLSEEEIGNVTGISCVGSSISDLTGIEYFTALYQLDCHDNQLTSLDVSNNTALEYLYCYCNQLTSLDVSSCSALTYLNCYSNQLTTLDVSQNTALTTLDCLENQLTSLDVTQNYALSRLCCVGNQLTSLDVSQNTMLTSLECYSNQLTSLDLTNNTMLLDENAECNSEVEEGITFYGIKDSHKETETVGSLVAIISPEEDTEGLMTRTSETFENKAFEQQKLETAIPALKDMKVLYLPSGLEEIEEEAFANGTFTAVIVPDGCKRIKTKAFINCSELLYVRVPDTTIVEESAFEDGVILD